MTFSVWHFQEGINEEIEYVDNPNYSGFQKRKESIHDAWEAGHSSTALSGGVGLAFARDLNKENHLFSHI